MRKVLAFLFVILSAVSVVSAQDATLKWINQDKPIKSGPVSDISIVKVSGDTIKFIQNNDNVINYLGNFLVTFRKFNLIHKFNTRTRVDTVYRINKPMKEAENKDKSPVNFLNFVTINDTLHVLSYCTSTFERKISIYDQTFNFDKMQLNEQTRCIAVVSYDYDKVNTVNYFLSSIFRNGNAYVMYYTLQTNESPIEGGICFDSNLNIISTMDNNQAIVAGDAYLCDRITDNEDNFYEIQRVYTHKNGKENKIQESSLYVIYYQKGAKEPKFRKINFEEGTCILSEALTITKDNQLLITGLYSKGKSDCAIGYCSYLYKPHLDGLIKTEYTPFTTEFLMKGLSDDSKQEMKKMLDKNLNFENVNYNSRRILNTKDSAKLIVFEKSRITFYTSNSNSWHEYFLGDLIVLKLKEDGTIAWVNKIVKNQKATDREKSYCEFYADAKHGDNCNFIYTVPVIKKNLFGSKTICHTNWVSLDAQGNETTKELFAGTKIPSKIIPKLTYYLGNGKYLVPFTDQVDATLFSLGKCNLYFGEMEIK